MPKLILVKHSNSNHNPHQPAAHWTLTDQGIARCRPLAHHLARYQPQRLFCSPMPKAAQTALHVSHALQRIPIIENPLLAEHSRQRNAPYGTPANFQARVQRLFAAPDELAFGDETANQAQARFQRGIAAVLAQADAQENLIVIAHGTVNVLFTAQHNAIEPYALWTRLKMPALIVLDLPDFRLHAVIEDAAQP